MRIIRAIPFTKINVWIIRPLFSEKIQKLTIPDIYIPSFFAILITKIKFGIYFEFLAIVITKINVRNSNDSITKKSKS